MRKTIVAILQNYLKILYEKIYLSNTIKKAAVKLGINEYTVKKFCTNLDTQENFEGLIAYFDSG